MRELKDNNGIGCCLTLTYAETDGKLHKEHLRDFIKRLREILRPIRIRYFGCGEYGGKRGRPHYHICIFGWKPDDLTFACKKNGKIYYFSKLIEKEWNYGYNVVDDIDYQTAFYCAKYIQKLDTRYHSVPPFTVMSLKPGIGALNLSYEDIMLEKIYVGDKVSPLPRYFVRKMEKEGFNVDILKMHRKQISEMKNEVVKDGYVDVKEIDRLHEEKDRIMEELKINISKEISQNILTRDKICDIIQMEG